MKNIALIGLGCVGQGFYDIFNSQFKGDAKVKYIVVKDPLKKRSAPSSLIFFEYKKAIDDADVGVVVEAIDDAEVAFEIAKATLKAGKQLVSANKKMLAIYWPELQKLANANQTTIRFEAAVGGAIPIISTLNNYLKNDEIIKLQGILNGTCNYILTQMELNNLSYQEALKQAQLLGFAESNPTLDVEGFDTLYKLVLLAAVITGTHVAPQLIELEGITGIAAESVAHFKAQGKRVKLIAELEVSPKGPLLSVKPQVIDANQALFNTLFENNAISIETQFGGTFLLQGKGAGAYPTGIAVYNDVVAALAVGELLPILAE